MTRGHMGLAELIGMVNISFIWRSYKSMHGPPGEPSYIVSHRTNYKYGWNWSIYINVLSKLSTYILFVKSTDLNGSVKWANINLENL